MENLRTEEGNADFGINKWPERQYGEFFQGMHLSYVPFIYFVRDLCVV